MASRREDTPMGTEVGEAHRGIVPPPRRDVTSAEVEAAREPLADARAQKDGGVLGNKRAVCR